MPNPLNPLRRRDMLATLGTGLPLSLAAWGAPPPPPASVLAAGSGVRVTFHIDLRAAIADGRFNPERDPVGVRAAAAPLACDRTLSPFIVAAVASVLLACAAR